MNNENIVKLIDVNVIWKKLIFQLEKKYTVFYTGNNPYHLNIDDNEVYCYIRNLTRAYSNHSFDVCRVQLHKTEKFEKIKESNIPLIVIGYCEKYSTVASWEPSTIKRRLNDKKNVSLYSRFSEMNSSEEKKTKQIKLTNGELVSIVDFSNVDLLIFQALNKDLEQKKVAESFPHLDLYHLIKDTLGDLSELKTIEICIDYFEKNNIEYDLLIIKELIKEFKFDLLN